jgi:hypothetical protein
MGNLGCHSVLFATDALMFYTKAVNLNRQMKLFLKIMENAQNAVENFHYCP